MRRFGLSDAMTLIAATAGAMVLVRRTSPGLGSLLSRKEQSHPGMWWFLVIQDATQLFVPFLATASLALVPLRVRRPRPRLRRAFRQPGATACVAASAAILLQASWIIAMLSLGYRHIHPTTIFAGYAQQVSFAVIGAWIGLAACGQWKPEPSWIDRAGRAIGVAWIVVVAIHFGRYFLTG